MKMCRLGVLCVTLLVFVSTNSVWAIAFAGELRKWHNITITLQGPQSSEDADINPFLDYRLNVTFSKGDKRYVVAGYYAADGKAGQTSAMSGNKWRVHFVPDEEGKWLYSISFRKGKDIALSSDADAGSPVELDVESGSFKIGPTDKTGRDHRAKGMLRYVGERYLQFAETGQWFLKGGADSPENFLAYADFDGTYDTANCFYYTYPNYQSQ